MQFPECLENTLFNISCLKMMVKSSLEGIFLKFLHALAIFLKDGRNFDQKYKFSNKNDMMSAWRNFNFFLTTFNPHFQARNSKISSIFHFDRGNNGLWIKCVNSIPQNHCFCISGIQHPFCLKNRLLYLGLPVVAVFILSLFPSFSNTLLLADFDTAEGLRVMRIFSTGTWGSSVSGVLGSP